MKRLSLFRAEIFWGLFIGLILSSISFAAEKELASNYISGYPAVLLKNQEYFTTLTSAIDEAKSEIIMSFFLFKAGIHKNSYPDRILSHLLQAAQRGVKVMLVLENSGGADLNLDSANRRTKRLLEDKGVEIYFDSPHKTTHTKLIVIDQRIVFLGSHNLTQSALKYNNEISIMINRPELAREARAYMLTIIQEAK
jgi:phosphatidylserine/phosphatidylglycerophosphate/cardiolipin synthase-like enzyme